MKNVNEYMSPVGWLIAAIACFPPIYILLEPTPFEFLVFFLWELVGSALSARFDYRFFLKSQGKSLSPYFSLLSPYHPDKVQSLSNKEKVEFVNAIMKFPKRRALWAYFWSFIKIIPGSCIILFWWEYPHSIWTQLALVMLIGAINFTYFYGASFIESHKFLSDLLAKIHMRFNWSQIFEQVRVEDFREDFRSQESWVLGGLFGFALLLNSILIVSFDGQSFWELVLKTNLVIGIGILLYWRVLFVSRSYVFSSLNKIIHDLELIDRRSATQYLPLHSISILANFERRFNSLIGRLRKSEQQFSSLVFRRSERSRHEAIGTMSALIAHDLARPIHIIKFCAEEIADHPELARREDYVKHLKLNADHCYELIDSLRARVKSRVDLGDGSASLGEAHNKVVGLLQTQFNEDDFKKIKISFDKNLEDLKLKMPSVDVVHILDNLYRNSASNLIKSGKSSPKIDLSIQNVSENSVLLQLQDNGSGLTSEEFEKLTAFNFTEQGEISGSKSTPTGLGLRLTRRLIEYHGGDMQLKEGSPHGTTLSISLPRRPSQEMG